MNHYGYILGKEGRTGPGTSISAGLFTGAEKREQPIFRWNLVVVDAGYEFSRTLSEDAIPYQRDILGRLHAINHPNWRVRCEGIDYFPC